MLHICLTVRLSCHQHVKTAMELFADVTAQSIIPSEWKSHILHLEAICANQTSCYIVAVNNRSYFMIPLLHSNWFKWIRLFLVCNTLTYTHMMLASELKKCNESAALHQVILIKHINFPYFSVHNRGLCSTDDLRPFGKHTNNSGRLAAALHEKLYLPLPEQHVS